MIYFISGFILGIIVGIFALALISAGRKDDL